jgi:hypothetical protein
LIGKGPSEAWQNEPGLVIVNDTSKSVLGPQKAIHTASECDQIYHDPVPSPAIPVRKALLELPAGEIRQASWALLSSSVRLNLLL